MSKLQKILILLSFSINSFAQDSTLHQLAKGKYPYVSVSSVKSLPCNSDEDCCENRDTVVIKKLNIEIQTYYLSGAACDGYFRETIIIRNETGCIKDKYFYSKSFCDSDDWYCGASWSKRQLTQKELQKLVEYNLTKAKKIQPPYVDYCD